MAVSERSGASDVVLMCSGLEAEALPSPICIDVYRGGYDDTVRS